MASGKLSWLLARVQPAAARRCPPLPAAAHTGLGISGDERGQAPAAPRGVLDIVYWN
jgi:hypothetical protein